MAGLALVPGLGDVAKLLKAKKAASGATGLSRSTKAGKRDWQDIPLSHRGKHEDLTTKFLDEHGFREYDGVGSRAETYEVVDDVDDKVKVIAYGTFSKGGKAGITQKTFRNPTLKSLRNWMGY